jgi:hypothetical protein
MSEVYWNNFCKWTTDYAAWLRMDKQFGGYAEYLSIREAKAFLELLHYHWSLDGFE